MVEQEGGWPTSQQIEWGTAAIAPDDEKNTDDNESVDSLEACLREKQQSPFDDRETFDKMEQALRDAQKVLNIDENVGGNSTKRKEDEDDTFDVTTLDESEGFFSDNDPVNTIPVGRKETTQSRNEVSRALYDANGTVDSSMQYTSPTYDDDYVTNMVEDTKRRRRKNEHKPSYWDTYDSVTVGSATIYHDDELDNSTLTGTYYFEDATVEDDRDERATQHNSSREENKEEIMDKHMRPCVLQWLYQIM